MTVLARRCAPVSAGWWRLVLAATTAVLATLLGAGTASATFVPDLQTRVGASTPVGQVLVGPHVSVSPGQQWGNTPPTAGTMVATGVATNGGAASVRLGQAGENAVRSAFDIGPKATVQIGDRTRIVDGLNDIAVSEVKNVKYQAYTQQLKDSLAYAQQHGLRFDLYVRGGGNPTTLSGPLEAAIRNGDIGLRYIP